MEHMPDSAMHGMQIHMIAFWIGIAVLGAMSIGIIVLLIKPASAKGMPLVELSAARGIQLPKISDRHGNIDTPAAPAVDTIFLLPDISNYTRFMTGTQFSFAHAQHIIFSLINAMIAAATRKVELSKLESDAALFFVDAGRLSEKEVGNTVIDIFRAFYQERGRLKDSNICPCHACRHLDILDLKVFVHRGQAARFNFRGSVDLFGTDVIVLHRIMKNNATGRRYVMITEAAESTIELPVLSRRSFLEQDVQHVGPIKASVIEIDDTIAEQLARQRDDLDRSRASVVEDTLLKLRENLRSIRYSLSADRQSRDR